MNEVGVEEVMVVEEDEDEEFSEATARARRSAEKMPCSTRVTEVTGGYPGGEVGA